MPRYIGPSLVLALLTSGCLGQGDNDAEAKVVSAATSTFYQRLAAKQFGLIYDTADPAFRAGLAPDLFIKFMTRVDRKLGPCEQPEKTASWSINVTTNGTFRKQGYTQKCANGSLNEDVSIVVKDGKAALVGYHVDSPLLMTD